MGLFCGALLQKRPIFLSILLIEATPYAANSTWVICRYAANIYAANIAICAEAGEESAEDEEIVLELYHDTDNSD